MDRGRRSDPSIMKPSILPLLAFAGLALTGGSALANPAPADATAARHGAAADAGPMRGPWGEALELDVRDRRSGWPLEMVLRAAARGWRIRDVPVEYTERSGRSKVTGTVRGTVHAIGDMSRLLREEGRR